MEKLIESMKSQMSVFKSTLDDAINAPLNRGLMDEKEHKEFKKDMDKYMKLLASSRNVEAESFLKKITKKYDKPHGV